MRQAARPEHLKENSIQPAALLRLCSAKAAKFPKGEMRRPGRLDLAQALNWIKEPIPHSGLLEFYRREAIKMVQEGRVTDFPAWMLKYL